MESLLKSDLGFIFCIHLIFIVSAYFSPLLFDWKIIIICAGIFVIQNAFLKDCILTTIQFGKKSQREEGLTFHSFYLGKVGVKFNKESVNYWNRFKISRKKYNVFFKFIFPVLIIVFAIIWQIYLGKNPLLF